MCIKHCTLLISAIVKFSIYSNISDFENIFYNRFPFADKSWPTITYKAAQSQMFSKTNYKKPFKFL